MAKFTKWFNATTNTNLGWLQSIPGNSGNLLLHYAVTRVWSKQSLRTTRVISRHVETWHHKCKMNVRLTGLFTSKRKVPKRHLCHCMTQTVFSKEEGHDKICWLVNGCLYMATWCLVVFAMKSFPIILSPIHSASLWTGLLYQQVNRNVSVYNCTPIYLNSNTHPHTHLYT